MVQHRRRIAGPFFTALATSSPDELIWSSGLAVLPPAVFEHLPQVDGGQLFFDPEGREVPFEAWNPRPGLEVAVDGSCEPHSLNDFMRASWALVFFDPATQEIEHSACGPVWCSLPQSPQAGEFSALAAAQQILVAKGLLADVHTDAWACAAIMTAPSSTACDRHRLMVEWSGRWWYGH